MKRPLYAALLGVFALTCATQASAATCRETAAQKKLAGAALASFMKKCERDAQAACTASAATKKLAGAAKTSHMTKCQREAVGQ